MTMTILGAASLIALISLQIPNWRLYSMLVLAGTLAAAYHFQKFRKDVMAARLIIENQIMHFKLAVFDEESKCI
jgi:hypothetical protein